MPQACRVHILAYYGFEKTVIESQVVTPARMLKQKGFDVRLIFMERFVYWWSFVWGGEHGGRYNAVGDIPLIVLPRIPKNFLFLNSALLFLALLMSYLKTGYIVVRARGFQSAAVILPLKKWLKRLKLVCDCRGIESEEYLFTSERKNSGGLSLFQKWWVKKLKTIEHRALENSEVISCVSNPMIEYLKGNIPGIQKEWQYVPCCVDVGSFVAHSATRNKQRRELGLEGRLVVVYSGAIDQWHIPEKILELYQFIQGIEPAAFFLGLTPDPDPLNKLLQNKGVKSTDGRAMSVTFEQIPGILASGDIGLLIRENNLLNRYSCPTKFAEYLAGGLHVIATDAVWEVRDTILQYGVGTIIPDLRQPSDVIPTLKSAVLIARDTAPRCKRSQEAAAIKYDWSQYSPLIQKSYLTLAGDFLHKDN